MFCAMEGDSRCERKSIHLADQILTYTPHSPLCSGKCDSEKKQPTNASLYSWQHMEDGFEVAVSVLIPAGENTHRIGSSVA